MIVLGTLLGFLIGLVAMHMWHNARKLKHHHIWRPIQVRNIEVSHVAGADHPYNREDSRTYKHPLIAYLCYCNEVKEETRFDLIYSDKIDKALMEELDV